MTAASVAEDVPPPPSRNRVMAVQPLHPAWRKCPDLIQENESWRYSHYTRRGGNVQTSFKKTSHGGTTITSGVEEMSRPLSRKRVMAAQLLHPAWRKCPDLIQETESWQYSHYTRRGGKVQTSFKKPSHGSTAITPGVEEMSRPHSRNRVMAVQPLHPAWRKSPDLIQETESWRYDYYIRCGGNFKT
jgi:hypothetical protein